MLLCSAALFKAINVFPLPVGDSITVICSSLEFKNRLIASCWLNYANKDNHVAGNTVNSISTLPFALQFDANGKVVSMLSPHTTTYYRNNNMSRFSDLSVDVTLTEFKKDKTYLIESLLTKKDLEDNFIR